MPSEEKKIRRLFKALHSSAGTRFPRARASLPVKKLAGNYVIFGPRGEVCHVGRTIHGKGGLHNRLRDHLAGRSSFAKAYLQGNGKRLRRGFFFKLLYVKDRRNRAMLEALATGILCPRYIR